MTREELACEVAERTGVSRKDTRTVLSALLDTITARLCAGETIYLRGFGCFESKEGRKRRARDPQGDGIIEIPPRIRPVFRPYNDMKQSIQAKLGKKIKINFLCLTAKNAIKVSVVGKFNNWNEDRNSMQRLPDGSWVAEIDTVSGQTFKYKYLIDGKLESDPAFPTDSNGNTIRQI
jgi:nucleoid DNA-binding protein